MPHATIVEQHVTKMMIVRYNHTAGLRTCFLLVFHKSKRERREPFQSRTDVNAVIEQDQALGHQLFVLLPIFHLR
jgi:hypothetical protein